MTKEKVYIEIKKKVAIDTDTKVKISHIAKVYSSEASTLKKVQDVKLSNGSEEENWDSFGSVDITEKILEKYPNLDLNVLGSTEVLIEYKSREEENKLLEFIKVASICILLFFGASIAIINFHQDVDTRGSMEQIYYTFTGVRKKNPLIIGIPYSIGIGAGSVIFFNRIFTSSKRRKKEPGPMEVQLYLHDDEIDQYVLNEIDQDKES